MIIQNIILDTLPEWVLKIYGEGSLHKILTEQIRRNNLQKYIFIEKPVNNIIDHYIQSSLCILSSRFEGFGMVLIEAMACGLPVVSFDCPNGPADIITDGQDGYLVENGNISQMADKICLLLEDDIKREAMGVLARKHVTRYSRETVMNQWDKLFLKLLSKRCD